MRRTGPLVTLLAGLATAAVLLILTLSAAPSRTAQPGAAQPSASQSTGRVTTSPLSPSASPPTRTAPSPKPTPIRATYAGKLIGGPGSIALVVRDDAAIAYVCDGQRVEAWLKGSAADRKLVLSPAKGTASLRGKYDKGSATGSVLIGRKRWTFHIAPVTAPSGLYRAAQQLRGARVVGGWIVLASGEQVGIVTTDSVPTSAPTLNTSTGQVMIGDTTVTPTPIDGTTGSGF